jgi:hypothetical protein
MSNKKWTKVPEDLPEAKLGDPNSPLYGQVLTAEEEKKVDDQGRPVVEGLPWSEAKTGLYLVVACMGKSPKADRPMLGGTSVDVPKAMCSGIKRNRVMLVGTFMGRPAFDTQYTGCALELPADLARDALKRQYVVEWLAETAKESLEESGVNLKRDRALFDQLALWLAMAAQDAIAQTGL